MLGLVASHDAILPAHDHCRPFVSAGSADPEHRRFLRDCARLTSVDERMKPVIVGLAAGILSVVLPSGLAPVVAITGALLAGWVLPTMPVMAAILFLAPALAVGAVRLVADDSSGTCQAT